MSISRHCWSEHPFMGHAAGATLTPQTQSQPIKSNAQVTSNSRQFITKSKVNIPEKMLSPDQASSSILSNIHRKHELIPFCDASTNLATFLAQASDILNGYLDNNAAKYSKGPSLARVRCF